MIMTGRLSFGRLTILSALTQTVYAAVDFPDGRGVQGPTGTYAPLSARAWEAEEGSS
jgi:hypothetical protein